MTTLGAQVEAIDQAAPQGEPRRTLRYSQVEAITGLCRRSIHRKIVAGEFPQPVELGANSIGFYQDEVVVWQERRPRRGYRSKVDN